MSDVAPTSERRRVRRQFTDEFRAGTVRLVIDEHRSIAKVARELDQLCTDARVAVELDGGQHLGDPEAYRRDRRKDQLLQEHGYFVRRFLAEDVGRNLDQVLDAVLRTITCRRRSIAQNGRA